MSLFFFVDRSRSLLLFLGPVGTRAPSWAVIKRHIPLLFLTHFFDYLGSIINYAAVGGAILYLSKAEGMSEAEIAALVARGSYSCLYLIDAFSQVCTFFFLKSHLFPEFAGALPRGASCHAGHLARISVHMYFYTPVFFFYSVFF